MAIKSVLLKTPLTTTTGYGNDGCSLARSFHTRGMDTVLMPNLVIPPIPMPVAMLLVKAPNLDFDYVIQHIDPQQIGLEGEKRLPGKKIAWSMWEFTRMDPKIAETLTERLQDFDALFVYDEVSYEAFQPHAEEAGIPLKILQGGFWSEDWMRKPGDPERDWSEATPFRFVMSGALHQRKNPFAAISAYQRLLEDGYSGKIELHLKTVTRTLHPGLEDHNPGLRIFYEMWPPTQMRHFYQQAHCVLAPSWGEGKHLPGLEAAVTGIPTIHSDFGGFRQWGSSEWSYAVPGLLDTHDGYMPSFRVDVDALYKTMKHAVDNRSEVRRKGELASRMIPAQCDWARVTQRFLDMTDAL